MLSFRKDIMMYDIEYYFDKNGYSAISDYFADLAKKSIYSKTVRIQKNKIFAYIKALKEYGTRIGNPIVKHIQGDLWELRPLNNRIFFFYWKDNKFVLLHYYIKKTQKTPHREISKVKSKFVCTFIFQLC